MQLSEKIQKIRKENNLTQEQFADRIFVSRTAVSKWETGRGTPSIDSLQMIAKEFNMGLDDLLSTDEIVSIAKKENQDSMARFTAYVDAIIGICALLAIILPIYKCEVNGVYYSTYIGRIDGWQGIVFWLFPLIISISGIIQLIFTSNDSKIIRKVTGALSYSFIFLAILLHVLSLQPYPALFFFILLAIKVVILLKKH